MLKDNTKLVCIRNYSDKIAGEMDKDLLHSQGVDAAVFFDDLGGIDPFLTGNIGYARLMVREEDVNAALRILDEH